MLLSNLSPLPALKEDLRAKERNVASDAVGSKENLKKTIEAATKVLAKIVKKSEATAEDRTEEAGRNAASEYADERDEVFKIIKKYQKS